MSFTIVPAIGLAYAVWMLSQIPLGELFFWATIFLAPPGLLWGFYLFAHYTVRADERRAVQSGEIESSDAYLLGRTPPRVIPRFFPTRSPGVAARQHLNGFASQVQRSTYTCSPRRRDAGNLSDLSSYFGQMSVASAPALSNMLPKSSRSLSSTPMAAPRHGRRDVCSLETLTQSMETMSIAPRRSSVSDLASSFEKLSMASSCSVSQVATDMSSLSSHLERLTVSPRPPRLSDVTKQLGKMSISARAKKAPTRSRKTTASRQVFPAYVEPVVPIALPFFVPAPAKVPGRSCLAKSLKLGQQAKNVHFATNGYLDAPVRKYLLDEEETFGWKKVRRGGKRYGFPREIVCAANGQPYLRKYDDTCL